MVSYLKKDNIDIYCETEDDVFQHNRSTKEVFFTQVKCFTEGFSLRSQEIQKSLLNFFLLYLKYSEEYQGEYHFETNAGTKPEAGKFLKDWEENQTNEAYVIKHCKDQTRNTLKNYLEK
jgi:hypothetical protein